MGIFNQHFKSKFWSIPQHSMPCRNKFLLISSWYTPLKEFWFSLINNTSPYCKSGKQPHTWSISCTLRMHGEEDRSSPLCTDTLCCWCGCTFLKAPDLQRGHTLQVKTKDKSLLWNHLTTSSFCIFQQAFICQLYENYRGCWGKMWGHRVKSNRDSQTASKITQPGA